MKLIDYMKSRKHNFTIHKILNLDINSYKNYYATSDFCRENGRLAARNILIYCHVVEKGLSHKNLKPLFAYERVSMIAESLDEYLDKGGNDSFIVDIAISTLKKYNSINRELGVQKDKLVPIPKINHVNNDIVVGIDTITEKEYFSKASSCFSEFSASRHSIRLYDCKSEPIKLPEIIKCIEIAQCCPSACNRQAVRVKVIQNSEKIKKICNVQGGANGFGENSGTVLIITADISLYEPSERRLPMLDCGLFIMNLIYVLYENKFGTCILNGSFTEEREREMFKLVPMPENEMYAAVIAVSKIPEGESIKIAHSCKRNVEDIVIVM